jgi:hypothetical protein
MVSAYAYLCRKNPYSMSEHVSDVVAERPVITGKPVNII